MSTETPSVPLSGHSLREKIDQLALSAGEGPCVTISLNTHRTHPDNAGDLIVLRNLCAEAEQRVIDEYGKRPAEGLLESLAGLEKEIDPNYLLDSLHVFISNSTRVVVRSPWSTPQNTVHLSDSFALRPLIKAYTRSQEYLIMLLSQSGVRLYHALNDAVLEEVRNGEFPIGETRHYLTSGNNKSDPKLVDDMVREFLNKVDKALVQVSSETGHSAVVICTEDNYTRLMQVADKPTVYLGYAAVNYNATANHQIAAQAWEVVRKSQEETREKAIEEVQEAVSTGKVITDLNEVFRAAKEGRGELLVVHQDFSQAVKMIDEFTFEFVSDPSAPGVIDDVSSVIAWEVLSKKGRVVVTGNDRLKDLGEIVLKTRY